MCDICKDVKITEWRQDNAPFWECVEYIRSLVDSGDFGFTFKTCEIDSVKNKLGYYVDDQIAFSIKCNQCGQEFTCSADTYHRNGRFSKDV